LSLPLRTSVYVSTKAKLTHACARGGGPAQDRPSIKQLLTHQFVRPYLERYCRQVLHKVLRDDATTPVSVPAVVTREPSLL
jgi:hypothetical protein